jgi:hypothetical protein
MAEVVFCLCKLFDFWYEEDGIKVCKCGHPAAEHLDDTGSCVGDLIVGV